MTMVTLPRPARLSEIINSPTGKWHAKNILCRMQGALYHINVRKETWYLGVRPTMNRFPPPGKKGGKRHDAAIFLWRHIGASRELEETKDH
jgi:hypothetical protein